MFKRYTLIGSSKSSMVFYDKKLKRAVTFDQFDLNKVNKKWSFKWFIYLIKLKKYGLNKLIIKSGYIFVPLILLIGLTFFRATYTTFHLYLFLITFVLLGVIVPIVIYKSIYLVVKYFIPRTARLSEVNDAFTSGLLSKSNVYEKITIKYWILNVIWPMCSIFIPAIVSVFTFFGSVIHNEIVNYPINKLSLLCNLGSGLFFGLALMVAFIGNLIESTLLLKKHQRGEIETLPDVEVETIVNKDDSIVEKEVSEKEYGK